MVLHKQKRNDKTYLYTNTKYAAKAFFLLFFGVVIFYLNIISKKSHNSNIYVHKLGILSTIKLVVICN